MRAEGIVFYGVQWSNERRRRREREREDQCARCIKHERRWGEGCQRTELDTMYLRWSPLHAPISPKVQDWLYLCGRCMLSLREWAFAHVEKISKEESSSLSLLRSIGIPAWSGGARDCFSSLFAPKSPIGHTFTTGLVNPVVISRRSLRIIDEER